ncbi:hypothetical protein JW711_01040 [Candidatus Woesearchaeota archaeon]|nr:hypothetical protein [Candidatus Woesearchaeota archaeon]
MGDEQKELTAICQDAHFRRVRRGEVVLCGSEHGSGTPSPPPILTEKDVCCATTFFSTGHSSPDCYYTKEKMYACPYRKCKEERKKTS